MQEFFGDLERFAADLYPYRWPIIAGIVVMLAAVGAFCYRRGWHMVLLRHKLVLAIVGTPLLVLTGFISWDLGSPLFTNKTVEEELPLSFRATIPPGVDHEDVELIMAILAKIDQEVVDEAMPKEMSLETEADGATSDPTPDATPRDTAGDGATSEQISTATTTQLSAVKLKIGNFTDQDKFHKGIGQATIYRGTDGSYLLRLENLDVTNGPDLHVFLTPHPDPDSRGDVKAPGHVDLGKLKGNRGNQNYPIADNVDIDAQQTVVIYCVPFSVIFSTAILQDLST